MRKTERKSNSSAPSSFIISMLVLFFLANMVINPSKFIQQALDGISAWAFAVLPSVLPFMFFTKILSSFAATSTGKGYKNQVTLSTLPGRILSAMS